VVRRNSVTNQQQNSTICTVTCFKPELPLLFLFQKKCLVLRSYPAHINISEGSWGTNGSRHHVRATLSTICNVPELVHSGTQIHYTWYVALTPQTHRDACMFRKPNTIKYFRSRGLWQWYIHTNYFLDLSCFLFKTIFFF
jgi:hypothetical protein